MEKLVALTASLLLLPVVARSVQGAPAQAPSTTTSPSDVTESCYTPIATSQSWLNSEGEWGNPCNTDATPAASLAVADTWGSFSQPSLADLAADAVPMFRRAERLARNLRQDFVRTNLLDAVLLVMVLDEQEELISTTLNVTGMTQLETVAELHGTVSLSLVYLEQSQHDEQPLCGRASTLLSSYHTLRLQLLRALCKVREMLDVRDLAPPPVPRYAMPEGYRRLPGGQVAQWRMRNARDYLVLRDVVAMTLKVARVLGERDWTSA